MCEMKLSYRIVTLSDCSTLHFQLETELHSCRGVFKIILKFKQSSTSVTEFLNVQQN